MLQGAYLSYSDNNEDKSLHISYKHKRVKVNGYIPNEMLKSFTNSQIMCSSLQYTYWQTPQNNTRAVHFSAETMTTSVPVYPVAVFHSEAPPCMLCLHWKTQPSEQIFYCHARIKSHSQVIKSFTAMPASNHTAKWTNLLLPCPHQITQPGDQIFYCHASASNHTAKWTNLLLPCLHQIKACWWVLLLSWKHHIKVCS